MRIEPPLELSNERSRMLAEGVDLSISLSSLLAMDAMALGASRVKVMTHLRPWLLVAADRDWISSDEVSLKDAFSNLLLWPETSKYFRTESRILAVASSVFVWRERAVQVLSGQAPPDVTLVALTGQKFAVGFNCE